MGSSPWLVRWLRFAWIITVTSSYLGPISLRIIEPSKGRGLNLYSRGLGPQNCNVWGGQDYSGFLGLYLFKLCEERNKFPPTRNRSTVYTHWDGHPTHQKMWRFIRFIKILSCFNPSRSPAPNNSLPLISLLQQQEAKHTWSPGMNIPKHLWKHQTQLTPIQLYQLSFYPTGLWVQHTVRY